MGTFRSLVLLCMLVIATAAHADEEGGPLVHGTLRTTVVVSDFERAYTLFHDILGMPVAYDLPMAGDVVNDLLGQSDKSMRIVIFDVDGTPYGRIAILAFDDAVPGEPVSVKSIDTGAVVIVFETRHIDEIHRRVVAAGYEVLSPPAVLFPNEAMAVQAREMIFIGPEGVPINLIQRGIPKDAAQ